MRTKVLYVEDEPFLGKVVRETLTSQGFDVLHIEDGAKVLGSFSAFAPDVCVLDIMLPHVDGYMLCRAIKDRYPSLPVIFLTAKTETADLVKGFEAGGTDYIRKPFSIEELIVRINNQINLSLGIGKRDEHENREIILGRYKYYPLRYELHAPSEIIKLSQREQEVLRFLLSNENRVVDRRFLLKTIWGDDSFFNSRTLDVYIRKLRTYFSEDTSIEIVTLKGRGYLFLVR